MNRIRIAALVGVGMMLAAAPALAVPASVTGPKLARPGPQVEQIRYRRNLVPEAIIGGLISGVVGGVLSGNCYFNDCGYVDGPYYGGYGYYGGGGGYVSGGGRVRGGGRGGGGGVRGGGGVHVGHAAGGGGPRGGGGGGGGGARAGRK
jgi:hypothetical protein